MLYAIAANLGRGIGWTAQNAIREARSCGAEIDTFTLEDTPDLAKGAMKEVFFDHRLAKIVASGDHDILHVWNLMGLESIKIAKEKGMKVIVERASTHPDWQAQVLESEYSNAVDPIDHVRMNEELELADGINVPSEFAASTFPSHLKEKITVIPFGVDTDHFCPKPQSHDPYRVLFAGDNILRKGIRYLLEAWESVDTPYWELMIKTNVRLGVRKQNIRLISEVPDMAELFNQADVFCLPTVEEGQALVVWEAMACGLPCVVTKEAGSLITDNITGVVVPSKDPKAIFLTLQDLVGSPSKRQRLGRAARNLAMQYPWSRYGKTLYETYQMAVGE